MNNPGLERACVTVGGQKALAALIGTTQSQVWYWLRRAKNGLPAEFALRVEKATGISRHALRPDLWALPSKRSARRKTR